MKYMNYEEMTVKNLFIEENGAYSIDCKAAVWATDKMHRSEEHTSELQSQR